MPAEVLSVSGFLLLGYLLFLAELVVPGGILGILGTVAVVYGCYAAFDLGPMWGAGSIAVSILVFAGGLRFLLSSKAGQRLTLQDNSEAKTWKSSRPELRHLVGEEGSTLTALRPAGVATFANAPQGAERLDVVSDGEFLPAGVAVRVVEVEGRRVLVEAIEGPAVKLAAARSAGVAEGSSSSEAEKLLSEKLQRDTADQDTEDLLSIQLQETD